MDLHEARRIGEGRTAEVFAWAEGRALKLFRDWAPERWAEEERIGTSLAHQAGLPAPAVYGLELIEGRGGIVFERVDGPTMQSALDREPWRTTWAARTPADVQRLAS